MDVNHIPDAAMTLAVTALFADGPSTLRNIGSWRVKETDRIAAMANELRKLGAGATEGPNWLRIEPPGRLRPATLDTYDDHRIAMSLSLAALGGAVDRTDGAVLLHADLQPRRCDARIEHGECDPGHGDRE